MEYIHFRRLAFASLLNGRAWGETFFLGEANARHAEEVAEVQEEQIWTLWQIGILLSFMKGVGDRQNLRFPFLSDGSLLSSR